MMQLTHKSEFESRAPWRIVAAVCAGIVLLALVVTLAGRPPAAHGAQYEPAPTYPPQVTHPYFEVPPYKVADLPHGRIYKAVHESCELYIAEGEMRVAGSADAGHFYSITVGRCGR